MLQGHILLAEDDERLGGLIVQMLEKSGYHQVDWVQDGEDAYDYTFAAHYEVVVLDWMMPGMSGVEVCRKLREQGYSGAILMLTARDTLQDRIEGLDSGADDYLVKPFELFELLARLRALGRRNFAPLLEEIVQISDMTLNRSTQLLKQGEQEGALSPREFQMLDLLLRNKGSVMQRELILERIWGYDADVAPKTVDATVKLLRKKLEPFGKADKIQSIRGVGYKFDD
ncbi:DNA-binding response regulator, OmpR family, contains REC and winged-helix (wHTH) domain [Paenibacillus algorifonticola]|uniref:DNA-binding response regulator, OmpR family, contains REC and winged-helix (WHTH) domain n=1 Tax=Paenibacillus algorifonticola TaxID=684063 RepID=A0A1I2A490_9BACL|nr:response regulator transcription factor [Paenibacillus algorifonticola]SFE38636.1 DNA-binding response regulator, OmpR family, contains REC and winged-helix (wHTH) domain [Paenibacillus algorifonticola]